MNISAFLSLDAKKTVEDTRSEIAEMSRFLHVCFSHVLDPSSCVSKA